MEAQTKKIVLLFGLMLLFTHAAFCQKWEQVNDFEITRRMGAVAFSWQGKGYVGFGHDYNAAYPFNDIDTYDPATGHWVEITYLDSGFRTCPFAFVLDDILYTGGGTRDSAQTALQDFYSYDLKYNKWKKLNSLPFKYAMGARAVVCKNKVYLLGGCTTSGCEANIWEYEPENDNWRKGKALPHKSVFGIAFALNGELYYGLGNGENTSDYSQIWKTNPTDTGGWTRMRSFTDGGRTMAIGIAIDSIHAIAGMGFKMHEFLTQRNGPYYNGRILAPLSSESDFMMNDLWLFNAVTGRWKRLPKQKKGRRGAVCFVSGNYLYVGMGNAENRVTKDVYRLDLGKIKIKD